MKHQYRYLIIGGGMAGASAIEGIRQHDHDGTIGLLCAEDMLPYNRPPLSKGLLLGKKHLDQIFIFDKAFYHRQKAEVHLKTNVKSIRRNERFVTDTHGHCYGYSKLLIATGGAPHKLLIGDGAVHYLHSAEDYLSLELALGCKEEFLVIGGGFIGAELAAGLAHHRKTVSMIFPGPFLLSKVLPPELAAFVTDYYRKKDIDVIPEDRAAEIISHDGHVTVRTQKGVELETEWVMAGVGLEPETSLAGQAGLDVQDGIMVNRYLQTSDPVIFAAGDSVRFPCEALEESQRVEHWDNARAQGRCAGVNMAGGSEPYVYLPYFFSDLFDLGFEAVGKVDSRMRTHAVWDEPFRKGVVAYLDNQKVKGVLLWNKWNKVEWARKLIFDQAYEEVPGDLEPLLREEQKI